MSISVNDVVESQAHIGTLKREAHPKTRKYWKDVVNDVVVIEPSIILEQVLSAQKKVQETLKEGKTVLLVCEKKMYADELAKLAEKAGVSYLNYKVPSGFLTNFDTLKKRIESMNIMTSFIESDNFRTLTKKEQLVYKRKLERVLKIYKGVKKLEKKPDLVIVVDGAMLDNFIEEIIKQKDTDNIIITGTNFKRRRADEKIILANMTSYKSLDFVLTNILS